MNFCAIAICLKRDARAAVEQRRLNYAWCGKQNVFSSSSMTASRNELLDFFPCILLTHTASTVMKPGYSWQTSAFIKSENMRHPLIFTTIPFTPGKVLAHLFHKCKRRSVHPWSQCILKYVHCTVQRSKGQYPESNLSPWILKQHWVKNGKKENSAKTWESSQEDWINNVMATQSATHVYG